MNKSEFANSQMRTGLLTCGGLLYHVFTVDKKILRVIQMKNILDFF